jgi:N-acetylmuramoyl-L-alanine amidase
MREASTVLAFSEELMKLLEADPAYAAFATRRTDVFVELPDRVAFAREKNANLFISIHADWFDDPSVGGAGAYTLSEEHSIESTEEFVAKQGENGTIAGIDIGEARDDVLRVLLDLERRETQIGSSRFAEKVRDALARVTPVKRNFVGHQKFHVLKAPDMPSVLLELGFMSNPDDLKRLTSPEWRAKAAKALKSAIDAWRLERGVREASIRREPPR